MTVEKTHDAYDQGETPSWAWPVHAFVAWLATHPRLHRPLQTHPPHAPVQANWRDSWAGLRESEWHRDQLIAQGVAQLLAGQPLQLDDTKIQLTPPATYGGPCPRTPFDMNRRFIALARWAADPEAIIRERFKRRLAHSPRGPWFDGRALRALLTMSGGCCCVHNTDAQVALMLSSARSARPSKHERGLTSARGPPQSSNADCLLPTTPEAPASGIAPACASSATGLSTRHDHARRHPSTSTQGHQMPCAGASLTMTGRRRKRRRPSSRPTLR